MKNHNHTRYFLSNVLRKHESIVLQAAEQSGFSEIYIRDDATDNLGKPVSDCIAVYSPYRTDHEPFWTKYREILDGNESNQE